MEFHRRTSILSLIRVKFHVRSKTILLLSQQTERWKLSGVLKTQCIKRTASESGKVATPLLPGIRGFIFSRLFRSRSRIQFTALSLERDLNSRENINARIP